MTLSANQAKLGMIATVAAITNYAAFIAVLLLTFRIDFIPGDTYLWFLDVFLSIACAMVAMTAYKLVDEEAATPELPYFSILCAVMFAIDAVSLINVGGWREGNGTSIIQSIWVFSLAYNLKNIIPWWVRIIGMIYGAVWFIQVFVEALFGFRENILNCGRTTCLGDVSVSNIYGDIVFIPMTVAFFVFFYALFRAYKKVYDGSGFPK